MKVILSQQGGLKELRIFDGLTTVCIMLPLSTQKQYDCDKRTDEYDYGADEVNEDKILDFAVDIVKALMDIKQHRFEASLDYYRSKIKQGFEK